MYWEYSKLVVSIVHLIFENIKYFIYLIKLYVTKNGLNNLILF